jgi:hypothetical protein
MDATGGGFIEPGEWSLPSNSTGLNVFKCLPVETGKCALSRMVKIEIVIYNGGIKSLADQFGLRILESTRYFNIVPDAQE